MTAESVVHEVERRCYRSRLGGQRPNACCRYLHGCKDPSRTLSSSVLLCKNVLHHMPSNQSIIQILKEVTRISEVAIVCEILDPMIKEGRWGRIRHYYYRHYLPEPEARFLTSTGVDELVSSLPRTTILERHNYRTINGVYACAILLGPQRVGRP